MFPYAGSTRQSPPKPAVSFYALLSTLAQRQAQKKKLVNPFAEGGGTRFCSFYPHRSPPSTPTPQNAVPANCRAAMDSPVSAATANLGPIADRSVLLLPRPISRQSDAAPILPPPPDARRQTPFALPLNLPKRRPSSHAHRTGSPPSYPRQRKTVHNPDPQTLTQLSPNPNPFISISTSSKPIREVTPRHRKNPATPLPSTTQSPTSRIPTLRETFTSRHPLHHPSPPHPAIKHPGRVSTVPPDGKHPVTPSS